MLNIFFHHEKYMTPSYTIYYWPIAIRGNFVRVLLAQAGVLYAEAPIPELGALRALPVNEQPYPSMAPPFLHDHEEDVFLSQTTSIVHYLGNKLNLFPDSNQKVSLCLKIMLDANDVLSELTKGSQGGPWKAEDFQKFIEGRFVKWLSIFEEGGIRHGLSEDDGYYLGTESPSVADLVVFSLWNTMERCLPALSPILRTQAPRVLALCDRLAATPNLSAFIKKQEEVYGHRYCSPGMEPSLRKVINLLS